MSIFNEAATERRRAIFHARQQAHQRLAQEQQLAQNQEQERQRQIALFRQIPLGAIFAQVNTTVWRGKGRIRDYTYPYYVDHAAGETRSPGEPVLVLEAGRKHKVTYVHYTYRRVDIPEHSFFKYPSPKLPFVVPYKQVSERKEKEKTQTEPVLLVASLKTVPFGNGTRDTLHLALGYGFEPTHPFQKTADFDTTKPEHSRNVTFYWSVDISLSYPLPLAGITQQIANELATGLRSVDPHREIFGHLVTLPEQPVGQRTPPPRFGAPIRKGHQL